MSTKTKVIIAFAIFSIIEIVFHPILNVTVVLLSEKYFNKFNKPILSSGFSDIAHPIQIAIIIIELLCILYLTRSVLLNCHKNRLMMGTISFLMIILSLLSIFTSLLVFSFSPGL